MNNWTRLKLLMWKNYCFRKYYWWIPVIEILFPMFLMYVIIKISNVFIVVEEFVVENTTNLHEREFEYPWNYDVVLYTPSNDLTENAMYILRLYSVPYKSGIKPASTQARDNENEIVLEIANSPPSLKIMGVIFVHHDNFTLHYKIRERHRYNTAYRFSMKENQIILPPRKDIYISRGFMAMMSFLNQHFLSTFKDKYRGYYDQVYSSLPYPQDMDLSPSRVILPTVSCFVVVFSSLILSGPLLYVIIAEKKNGLKGLLKIIGVPEKLMWFAWFFHTLPVGILVYSIITVLLKFDLIGINETIMYHAYWSILWTCFLLFHIAQFSFCFMLCTIFNSILLAIMSCTVTTISVSYLAYKCYQWNSTFFIYLSCFIPVGAFVQSFSRFAYYEMLGMPLAWTEIFLNAVDAPSLSVGFTFIFFIFDTFLYLFLSYYFSVIHPSLRGLKMSPFFLFDKELLKKYRNPKKRKLVKTKSEPVKKPDNPFIETPSANIEISLVLENLEKNFGYVQAVKNLNLTLYKYEIVVLLGFAESGKTTTLSIITGLTEPTNGKILFKGIDILKNLFEFRKNIGVYLQEDSLFPYMSVLEHLIFFGMLKGAKEDDATEEAKQHLTFMNLESNADDVISVASKEIRRKLSLSIALMGMSDILILDEPTKGLDTLSKRKIWELLTELRKKCTIICTSSSIEEAVTIGDRIAVMHQGLIVAHGSTEFFKRTFGIGYRLKLLRKKIKDSTKAKELASQLIDLVQKSIPGSKMESRSVSEIVFRLSSRETAKFPELIRSLEFKKSALNIDRVEISGLSLDRLFLQLGGKSVFDITAVIPGMKPVQKKPIVIEYVKGKIVGLNLELLQQKTLFIKKFLYMYRNAWIFILRVVMPTIFLLFLLRGVTKYEETDPPLELTLKEAYPNSIVLTIENDNSVWSHYKFFVAYLQEMGVRIKILPKTGSDIQVFLKYAKQSISTYRREVIMGSNLNKPNPNYFRKYTLYSNRWAIHSVPVTFNTMSNVLLRHMVQSDIYSIIPVNHPIKPVNVSLIEDKYNTDLTQHSPVLTVWFILLAFFTIDLLEYFAFPVKMERVNGFKQIQHLSGVSVYTYWINNFIFDFLLYLIIIICRLILFMPFDSYDFFSFRYHILIVLLIILLYCASGLLFIYVLSFSTNSTSGSYLFLFFFNIICACTSFLYYKYETSLLSGSATSSMVHIILACIKYFILLVPPLNFSLAMEKLIMAWRVNHMVEAFVQVGLSEKYLRSNGTTYLSYLEYTSVKNPNGILEELQFLAIDIFLYAVILYATDLKFIIKFLYSIKYRTTEKTMETSYEDSPVPEDVLEERNRVEVTTKLIGAEPTTKNVLIVEGLKKMFERIILRPLIAVNDVSFVVEAGKCFGILGPKDAGKTTILKILTGEILPTKGDFWIQDVKLNEDRNKYLSQIGYCAEANCFLEELTGKETLSMIASLRGITPNEQDTTVDKWLSILDLQAIANRACGSYSDSDKRKLCAIFALIGNPSVIFLDGSTTGISPVTRQMLYNALIQAKSAGQAIALATRSIEECAILCDRLTVLVKGNMKFIGTVEQLKTKHGQGFSLSLTLKEPAVNENKDAREERIQTLKKLIDMKFKKDSCVLKEETQVLLRYHIKNNIPLADAFQRMEELKKIENIIVDYLLTQRSLEEIYLSFIEDSE